MHKHPSFALITALTAGLTACGDAGPGGTPDGAVDAPTDTPPDAPRPLDAGLDASPDAPGDPPLPPITRAQSGGVTAAVAIAGHRAFVGVGPRLTVWDLGAGAPTKIGESEPLSGVINGLEVVADTVFVVSGTYGDGAFHVVDAADPAAPVERARLRLGTGSFSHPAAVDVEGTTAYVVDSEQGVFRVDVSLPLQPVVTGFQRISSMTLIEASGDRVRAAGAGWFGVAVRTFDATSSDLAPLGTSLITGATAAALTEDGLLLTRSSTRFAVDDLANPTVPRRLHSEALAVWAMVPGGGGAWLTIDGRLRFLDLTDRGAITLGPPNDEPVWAVAAASFAGDRLAFASHQGLLTAFALPPGGPSLLGTAATGPCADCYATASHADLVAIAETTPGAVAGISTAHLGDLERDGQHQQLSADFEDVAYGGGRVYVADWFSGLRVFDVRDPARPAPAASVTTGTNAGSVAVSGRHVYLGESTNGGALRVFSHHETGAPVELGAIATGQVAEVVTVGDLVFTAEADFNGTAGMRVYDAADPEAIALIGTAPCEQAISVAVEGDLALLSCVGGVHVIDVGNPAAPFAVALWLPPGAGTEPGVVALDGTRGYFGHRRGVTVVDLATPSAPVVVDELPTAWPVRDLTVAGPGRLIASASRGGIYQWQM